MPARKPTRSRSKARPPARSRKGKAAARGTRPPEAPRTPPRPRGPAAAAKRVEDAPELDAVERASQVEGDLEGDFEGGDPGELGEAPRSRPDRVLDEEDLLDDAAFDALQVEVEEPEEGDAEEEAEPDPLERDPEALPPVVAIVGRPNVGKSTLLNALSGSRIAIVEATPGVTRDRVGVLCTLADRTVEIVDTGGVGIVDRQGLSGEVEEQVRKAVDDAALILFVTDAREGLTPLDQRVAGLLRRATARVIPVANKAETERVTWNVGELEGLGFGKALVVSAQERIGLDTLEETIAARLPPGPTTPRRMPAPEMKLAIVGRVNAGKSSIVNALLRQRRMIVSSVPGTTRDTVDVRFERDGRSFVVIDTAGIRKERAVQGGVDFYAQRRAERAMRRADVSAIVLDATQDVSRLDRKIAGYALDHHHPVLIVVNKWDLRPPDLTTGKFAKYVRATLKGLTYAPIVYTTATDGRNVDVIVDVARGLFRQAATRIKTAALNKAIERAQQIKHPRPYHGRVGQIYYGTQVEERPPTFVLFVNDPTLFDSTYRRFLENQFRATLPIPEVPLRVFFKARHRSPSKNELGPKLGE